MKTQVIYKNNIKRDITFTVMSLIENIQCIHCSYIIKPIEEVGKILKDTIPDLN